MIYSDVSLKIKKVFKSNVKGQRTRENRDDVRGVTLSGGMADWRNDGTDCRNKRNIRNNLRHEIFRIFCIWFELDWQKSRGKKYTVVWTIKNSIFLLQYTIDLMTVLKAILTGEGSCIYRNLLSDDFHKTAVLKKKKRKEL